MNLLIAYDISDSKRLVKVGKIMENYGERVQLSVFEAQIGPGELKRMIDKLTDVIDEEVDGVKIFELCERCFSTRWSIGDEKNQDSNMGLDFEIL